MSRYLINESNESEIEQADKGFQISAEVMVAASDEGAYGITHRELDQLLLKTSAYYAELSIEQRYEFF